MAGGTPAGEVRLIERVFFDTNVVLDVLLNRQPWVVEASVLWKAVDEGRIIGYVAATTLTNIFYLARRAKGLEGAYEAVAICLDTFEVCGITRNMLSRAARMGRPELADFEDIVQIVSAAHIKASAIVTRDATGFKLSKVPVYTPAELLALLK